MTNPSLKIGDNKWAVKESNLLGYRTLRDKYIPIELDVTRSTTATRVNEAGLIEETPYNLLTYSNDFSNGSWIKQGVTAIYNYGVSVDGGINSTLLSNSNWYQHLKRVFNVISSNNYTYSVYVRNVTSGRISIRLASGTNEIIKSFIISNGQVINDTGNQIGFISAEIKLISNDWYKLSLSFTAGGTSLESGIYLNTISSTIPNSSEIYGVQINAGSFAKPYFPTTDRLNIPQIDYTDGYSSLLIEPQRTNLVTYSEQFDDASWFKQRITIVSNSVIGVDGLLSASSLIDNSTNGAHQLVRFGTWQNAVQQTFSIYVKADSLTKCFIANGSTGAGVFFDLSNGTIEAYSVGLANPISDATINPMTNGWYRLTATHTATASQTLSFGPYKTYVSNNLGLTATYIGTGQKLFIYGAQLEQGSYPTSYIPTVASTVTRNATTVNKTGISDLINSEEGTLFVKAKVFNNNNFNLFSLHENITNNNRLFIGFNTTNNSILFYLEKNGSVQINESFNVTDLSSSFIKVAFVYKVNNSAFFINGIKVGGDLLCETFGINTLSNFSFSNASGSSSFNGNVKQLQIYKEALTDTECIALTTI